ncbi:MAG: hypothetical protein ACREVB_00055 [Burkholderiales bacterium]
MAIRAVVVKSARISVKTPHRIGLATTPGTESLRVTLVPEDAGMRLVFTP